MKTALVALILLLLLLLAAPSSAQTGTPLVNPTHIQFTSESHTEKGPSGEDVLTTYKVEFWLPGDDMITGAPRLSTIDLAKGLFSAVPSTAPVKYELRLDALGVAIPVGPTYQATVLTKGPAGYGPRSAASNPFTYPLPTPLPKAAGAPQVVKK